MANYRRCDRCGTSTEQPPEPRIRKVLFRDGDAEGLAFDDLLPSTRDLCGDCRRVLVEFLKPLPEVVRAVISPTNR